jgi:hypothetical protein
MRGVSTVDGATMGEGATMVIMVMVIVANIGGADQKRSPFRLQKKSEERVFPPLLITFPR